MKTYSVDFQRACKQKKKKAKKKRKKEAKFSTFSPKWSIFSYIHIYWIVNSVAILILFG